MGWSRWFLILTLCFQIPKSFSSFTSDLFDTWCKQHKKTYSSEQEKLYRLKVFEDNYAFVTHHNTFMVNSSYTLSLNAFADLTHHEFKASRFGRLASKDLSRLDSGTSNEESSDAFDFEVPSSVDWRASGAVSRVKDQSKCGACWAFSATGAMEGINKIVTGTLVSLSEQELVDCDRSYNNGCNGGLMNYAFEFVVKNQGIDSEEDYPFQGGERTCSERKLNQHVVTIDGYTDVPPNKEKRLLQAVAAQPVSVGICGSERAFQLYSKGIFDGPCSTSLDHAVLIVGYGSEKGVDYWIVRNSWGTHWGMSGYMHMLRNSGDSAGVCGINMLASYPTKTGTNPPPPPSPGPSKCDLFTSCSPGETCCCTKHVFGVCMSWKCCELNSAVCCKDGTHCCPHDYPICDTRRNKCIKKTENGTMVKEIEKTGLSGKLDGWGSLLKVWNM
ncbi:low-temperature-induced cysteine proteinase [Actinidia eriantha]|uniref:low-temperature-induced cysteine proteinase n=1 Tax=Actinidia eriantha TaxID=165200 RepID=UPI00258A8FF6|nr:low-temperature-induced cysteine proteinase [Actinidia eriantha]